MVPALAGLMRDDKDRGPEQVSTSRGNAKSAGPRRSKNTAPVRRRARRPIRMASEWEMRGGFVFRALVDIHNATLESELPALNRSHTAALTFNLSASTATLNRPNRNHFNIHFRGALNGDL